MCRSGDILFAGLDSARHEISFIATSDLAPGCKIIFSRQHLMPENGRLGLAGYLVWQAPQQGLEAGSVVTIGRKAGGEGVQGSAQADIGTVDEGNGGLQLDGIGDGLIAVEGRIRDGVVQADRVIAYVVPCGPAAHLGDAALVLPQHTDYFTYDLMNRPDMFDTRREMMRALLDPANFITLTHPPARMSA